MIDLYTWNTPNGQKPALLLEEIGLDYTLHGVDIGAGEQHAFGYLKLNPNGKIPTLVDRRGDTTVTLFESGAILLHLAETANLFLPPSPQGRADALNWAFWQVGGLGPMIGQWGHFLNAEGQHGYAMERYLTESLRLFGVLESRLAGAPYLAGADYSIADMMVFPWAEGGLGFLRGQATDRVPDLPAVDTWISRIAARPATQSARAKLQHLS